MGSQYIRYKSMGGIIMEKVHILMWYPTKKIHSIYADYKDAKETAKILNSNRAWLQTLFVNTKWVVQTFTVRDRSMYHD